MLVTWKVSDIILVIIAVIKDFLYVLFMKFPAFSCPLFLYGVSCSIDWVDTTTIEDLIDVVPLTYEEQKEMAQLHHCKVYQE
jgi:hypothetical protein